MAGLIDYRINTDSLEQGIFDIPFEEYKQIPALNIHSLQHMGKSAAHFKWHMEQPDRPPSADMIVGQCFDLALTEPGKFSNTVVQDLGINKNKTEYKEWAAKIAKQGKISLPTKGSKTTLNDIKEMVRRVKGKESARELLSEGYPQKTVIWFDPQWGIWCKGRPDWLTSTAIVVDLKKAREAGFFGFTRQAYSLKYYWQAAWYLRGMTIATDYEHTEFRFVVCEDSGPLESQVFRPSFSQIDHAQASIEAAVTKLINCLDSDDWPGYPDYVIDMESGQAAFEDVEEYEDAEIGYSF
jgi:hypothetical protein